MFELYSAANFIGPRILWMLFSILFPVLNLSGRTSCFRAVSAQIMSYLCGASHSLYSENLLKKYKTGPYSKDQYGIYLHFKESVSN